VPGFKEQDLVRHLSVDDFQAYLKSRLEILEEIARLNKPLDERARRVLPYEIRCKKTMQD
jgi:hypothetical protein